MNELAWLELAVCFGVVLGKLFYRIADGFGGLEAKPCVALSQL
jgi:hypothetical protein